MPRLILTPRVELLLLNLHTFLFPTTPSDNYRKFAKNAQKFVV